VAAGMLQVIPCERIGIAVIGLEVRHAHIHLVPLKTIYDIDFKKPKLKLSDERFVEIAAKISEVINKQA
jgi:histidine triad (HIT) family protein